MTICLDVFPPGRDTREQGEGALCFCIQIQTLEGQAQGQQPGSTCPNSALSERP